MVKVNDVDKLVNRLKELQISSKNERCKKVTKSPSFNVINRLAGEGALKNFVKAFGEKSKLRQIAPKRLLIQKSAFDLSRKEEKKITSDDVVVVEEKKRCKRCHESDTDQESPTIVNEKKCKIMSTQSRGFARAFRAQQAVPSVKKKLLTEAISLTHVEPLLNTAAVSEPKFSKALSKVVVNGAFEIDAFLFRILNWVFDWLDEEGRRAFN